MRPPLVFLLVAVGLLAACGGGQAGSRLPPIGTPVTAPPQTVARLVLVRTPGASDPQKVDLVNITTVGGAIEVLTGRSSIPGVKLLGVATPSWSPDGKEIYFAGTLGERRGKRYTYDETDVFAMRADGSGFRRLTARGDAVAPVASSDGRFVAFARFERAGSFPVTSGLWLMRRDGSGAHRLISSSKGFIDTPGAWSPDGRTFLFTRCRFTLPGPHGLIPNRCGVVAVTRGQTRMRQLAYRAQAPTYSPDGTHIAFVSDRDENGTLASGEDEDRFASELYIMNADGSNVRRLTRTRNLAEQAPSWSPDGSWIAYGREGPARFTSQVMLVRADGTCQTRVIGNAESDTGASFETPRWRPGRILDRRRPPCRS